MDLCYVQLGGGALGRLRPLREGVGRACTPWRCVNAIELIIHQLAGLDVLKSELDGPADDDHES